MKYTILLKKQKEGGYTAQCLEVPGAISQGETKEEAIKNAKEALALVLEVLKEEARKKGVEKVEVVV
jgi:predicted RNase H-like HicB family nuclease